jgi:aminoglycoside phosphotransferase (APT) family kinase protein
VTAPGVLAEGQAVRLADWMRGQVGIGGVRATQRLSGGNANLTLLLESDAGPLVLRTPPADTVSPRAHRGIQREATVLAAIEGRVRAPSVVAWCEDDQVIGRPFLVVTRVNGISLTDTLPSAYADSAATVNRLGEALVDELAAIHTLPWAELGLEGFGQPEQFLQRQIERWRGIRAQTAVRPLPALERLAGWLLDHLPDGGPVGLVHGDYHLDNTLVDPGEPRLAAVIDWELATIGDPLSDLGLFLMFWGPRAAEPPGFRHVQAVSRRPGVVSRRELASRWAGASGLAADHLDFYLAFAFWRLAAIVEGAYCLYREGRVDSAYARALEYDVPALLAEAEEAAAGRW